jgi:hypothetical protein
LREGPLRGCNRGNVSINKLNSKSKLAQRISKIVFQLLQIVI